MRRGVEAIMRDSKRKITVVVGKEISAETSELGDRKRRAVICSGREKMYRTCANA